MLWIDWIGWRLVLIVVWILVYIISVLIVHRLLLLLHLSSTLIKLNLLLSLLMLLILIVLQREERRIQADIVGGTAASHALTVMFLLSKVIDEDADDWLVVVCRKAPINPVLYR